MGVAVLFYVDLIGLSLYTIFGFTWQTRFRYPFLYFRKIGNTVPFFYYQAVSPETPRSMFQTTDEKIFAADLYAEDLVRFLQHIVPEMKLGGKRNASEDRFIDSETPQAEENPELRLKRRMVRDELQQYFLLISYQGYVNQYEVKMNNQFLYGLIASVGAAAALAMFLYTRG